MADLLGVVVGGRAIAASLAPRIWERRQDRLALRGAVRASINGIIRMYISRNFEETLKGTIGAWSVGSDELPTIAGSEEIREDPILHRLGEKVGLLGPDAADVVTFTNMITEIDVDMQALAKGKFSHLSTLQRSKVVETDLVLWTQAEQLGRDLVARLERD